MADTAEKLTPEEAQQKYWLAEISRAEKHFEDWFEGGNKLLKLYRNERGVGTVTRRYAMLWANTEVLKPAVYARPPVPQVSRRFKDRDPVARSASELLERAASYEVERMNMDSVLRTVRDDVLLPGRGTAWVRYEADISSGPDDDAPVAEGNDDAADAPAQTESVTGQRVIVDYVPWRQFLHNPARTWEEVWWVAKVNYLDEQAGKKRFGKAWNTAKVALDHGATSKNNDLQDNNATDRSTKPRATVYEIWCKRTGKVHFIAKAAEQPLEEVAPPLAFEGFWPCPRPVYATLTTDSLKPRPDYSYYQDQAEEINDLTARIAALTDGLKLVGFYPAGGPEDVSTAIEKALRPEIQNAMIPVSSWAAFSEKGAKGGIVYLPLVEVVEAIRACVELRNQLVQDVYQITGISDIMRGATDPNETKGAQQLKAQMGSVRIRDRQQEILRFARDLIRMICEVIAEQFDPQRVMQMANMEPKAPPPQPPQPMQPGMMPQPDPAMLKYQQEMAQMQEAFALLKDERLRGFRIDIETDSTIQPDEDAEKQRRVEFVQAMGGLLQQGISAVQAVPEIAPMIGETLLFVARGFRAGRGLEQSIEEAMEKLQSRIQKQLSNPQPDPEQQKMQAEMEKMKMEMEALKAKIAMEMQAKQADMQMKAQEGQMKLRMEREKMALEQQKMQMELQGSAMAHQQLSLIHI